MLSFRYNKRNFRPDEESKHEEVARKGAKPDLLLLWCICFPELWPEWNDFDSIPAFDDV